MVDVRHDRRHDVTDVHGEHPPAVTKRGEHVRGLPVVAIVHGRVCDDVSRRRTEAAPFVVSAQAGLHRRVGGFLQPDVECGLDGQAFFIQLRHAIRVFEVLSNLLD